MTVPVAALIEMAEVGAAPVGVTIVNVQPLVETAAPLLAAVNL